VSTRHLRVTAILQCRIIVNQTRPKALAQSYALPVRRSCYRISSTLRTAGQSNTYQRCENAWPPYPCGMKSPKCGDPSWLCSSPMSSGVVTDAKAKLEGLA
jgi:hypothetical protein